VGFRLPELTDGAWALTLYGGAQSRGRLVIGAMLISERAACLFLLNATISRIGDARLAAARMGLTASWWGGKHRLGPCILSVAE